LRSKPVEDLRDLERGMSRGALEEQVLDEMRDPWPRVVLVAGARPDPEPECDRSCMLEPLGDDTLAGVELGQFPVLHAWIVRRPRTPPVAARKPTAGTAAAAPRITAVSSQKRSG